jgi:transcriptional regulator with XRE-family HTH domain/KaiC/GvpD/RAD55 family RecA-like ATPase
MPSPENLTTGLDALDQIVDGLHMGDNVVLLDDAGSLAWTFARSFLQASVRQNLDVVVVTFDHSPKMIMERIGTLIDHPRLIVLDCFTSGLGQNAPVFQNFYQESDSALLERVVRVDRPEDPSRVSTCLFDGETRLGMESRLLFDSATGMQQLWGGEDRLTHFYARSCPRLYELNTVAYWIMEKQAHSQRLKAKITQIAQLVMDLTIKRGTSTLTLIKADRRDPEHLQKPIVYRQRNDQVQFDHGGRSTGGMDLGRRIKELRTKRGLSQTEVARSIGVTPSTISQVENGLIYPSLPALMKIAEILNVSVASFFREIDAPRQPPVFRPEDAQTVKIEGLTPDQGAARRLLPLDFETKYEPVLIELEPGQRLNHHFFAHKGEEFGYVLSGRLEVDLGANSLELSPGAVMALTTEAPSNWHNPGAEKARVLWIKIG